MDLSDFSSCLILGMDSADRWWDIGLTVGAWAMGIVGSVLLSFIAHFARKADKKLDKVVEVQGRHAELFAAVLERGRNHDDWRKSQEREQEKQWGKIDGHEGKLADHGKMLADHEATLRLLK